MSSKTQEPCDCGAVSHILNDPHSSLILNERNQFVLGDPAFVEWMVYHCPFCGGLLPDSRHPIWYPRLDETEQARLQLLIEGITTAEAAMERLGPPDYDQMMGHYDSIAGQLTFNEELSNKCRNVEYYNLSEHANIEFYFDRDHGMTCKMVVKSISPRHLASE